jgi:hypothetical protein
VALLERAGDEPYEQQVGRIVAKNLTTDYIDVTDFH